MASVIAALGLEAAPDDTSGLAGVGVGPPLLVGGAAWVPVVSCEAPDAALLEPASEDRPRRSGLVRGCRMWLARVADGLVNAKALLVAAEVGFDASVRDLLQTWQVHLFDVDGDGVSELLVETTLHGEVVPMMGPQVDTWLTIVDAAEGDVLWSARIEAFGSGGQTTCRGTVTFEDLTCDGRRDIRHQQRCWTSYCWAVQEEDGVDDPCPGDAPTITDERFIRAGGERAFRALRRR